MSPGGFDFDEDLDDELSLQETLPEDFYTFMTRVFRKQARDRGINYALAGNVIAIDLPVPARIDAEVLGSHGNYYEVSIDNEYSSGSCETVCSCPVGVDCKHGAAVLYRLLAAAVASEVPWAKEYRRYLPSAWRHIAAEALPPVKGNAIPRLLAAWAGEALDIPGSGDPGPPWWERFSLAESAERRALLEAVFKAHFATAFQGRQIYPHLAALAYVPNPLEALLEFRRSIAAIPGQVSRQSPLRDPALDSYLESPEAQAALAALDTRIADQLLLDWLEEPEDAPDSSAALEWRLIDAGLDYPVLAYRYLLSTKKLVRSPRHAMALEQLGRDLRSGQRRMRPLEKKMTTWLAGPFVRTADPRADRLSVDLRVENPFEWLLEAPATRWRWDDGGPVRIDPEPARLALQPLEDGGYAWGLEIRREDAAQLHRLEDVELFYTRVAEYRTDVHLNKLWLRKDGWIRPVDTAGTPLDLALRLLQQGRLPLDKLRESGAGAKLVERLGDGGADVSDLAVEVPVETRVEFRVEGGELRVQAAAHARDGMAFIYDHAGGWRVLAFHDHTSDSELQALPGAADAPGDSATGVAAETESQRAGLAAAPRRADTEPLEHWLAALLAGPGTAVDSPRGGRAYRLNDDIRMQLLEHWGERPQGITCFGNKGMQDLVLLRRPPEFKLNFSSSGVDWLDVSVSMQQEMELLTPAEVDAALAQGGSLVRLARHGVYDRAALEAYQQQMRTLSELGIGVDGEAQRLHAFQIAGTDTTALGGAEIFEQFAAQARRIAAKFKGIPESKPAKEAADALRPYQRAGTDFLVWAAKTFGGAVLADDMGLGKTLQVLAALTALRRGREAKKTSLVVCPASVAHNWQREAARFAPELKTVVLESGAGRKAILERLGDYDLVIKNYALARRDYDALAAQSWLMVCVDEAQAIKNPDAEISRVVKNLDARYRIALTGTPIENRALDLWSIADFAVPGYLGPRDRFEERGKDGDPTLHRFLRARLRPVLMRRLKQEVAPELPPRIEERHDCAMTTKQRMAYLAELKRTRELLATSGSGALKGQARIQMLAALTRLRQICCDPRLRKLPGCGSGKLTVLNELLAPLIEEGAKVLIFSQFVEMIKLLQRDLVLSAPCYVLTGQTKRRQELVDAFQAEAGAAVFLISLKAGGTGLNLTSASYVVLFDPWWNPAAEAQAIDRTHRIGQDKTVLAFRLVTTDTIEERILDLQEQKRDLVKNILDADGFNRSLSRNDFEYLLRSE
ncbi:MAG: hypothetical protein GC168_10865 [Candidatus Hydrogenedens sp.]|nr:hypothetical protein [Candidatus Hydrogenedens sp.]